jgi:5-methyltetrahydropteroyltriglutamate--homocysteine methyltransferase
MVLHRADHVGSLLRPAELLAARAASDPHTLKAVEDRHVSAVLGKQKELGFTVFTDGELRRRNFMSDFFCAVEGLEQGEAPRSWSGDGAHAVSARASFVAAKLRQTKRLTGHELPFLREHSPGAIKMTIPSANQFPAISYKAGVTEKAYPTHSDLLWDVVAILKGEVAALATEGIAYLQIDAPRYSYYVDARLRERLEKQMGRDSNAVLEEAIRADNSVLSAADRHVIRAIHVCRGNNRSQWYAEGGYDVVAEQIFNSLAVDRFLLEYDDARSGSFEPLRFVPRTKTVVLGLVSSKSGALESKAELIRRIDEAARYVPLENLALSPQCGFASSMEGNTLSEEEQWAKLRLVVQVANEVWR